MSGVEEAIAEVLDDCWWTWRGSKDTAARLVAAVRVMSPTLVAELIDGETKRQYAIAWDDRDIDWPFYESAEAQAEAERVRIDAEDTFAILQRLVIRTPWRPLTPNTETRKT